MNIVNEKPVKVFKNENKYTVGVSKKNKDGEYENAYFPIQFNKDTELEDKIMIKLKNAWLSFYKWEYEEKKGTTFFIKCNDFEIVDSEHKVQKEESNPFAQFGKDNGLTIDDKDLPF